MRRFHGFCLKLEIASLIYMPSNSTHRYKKNKRRHSKKGLTIKMRNTSPAVNISPLLSLRFLPRVSASSVCYLEQPIYRFFNDQISNHTISFSWLWRKTQDLPQFTLELWQSDRSVRFPECSDNFAGGLPRLSQWPPRLADAGGRTEEAREGPIPEKLDVGCVEDWCAWKTQTTV